MKILLELENLSNVQGLMPLICLMGLIIMRWTTSLLLLRLTIIRNTYTNYFGDSPSGKAADSDSAIGGSNPSSPTK